MQDYFWIDVDVNPPAPGWYAVMITYDEIDCCVLGGDYWDGSGWLSGRFVVRYGQTTAATKNDAEALAYDNDPDA